MKKSILLSVVFYVAILLCGTVQAQVMQYDSLAVDSVLSSGANSPQNVEGLPDFAQAEINESSGLIGVFYYVNGAYLRLEKGAQLHFYWIKQSSDSCGGKITFTHLPDAINPNYGQASGDTALVMEGGIINQENETTIIVPDTAINTISMEIAEFQGATDFYIDAIVLVQNGSESVALTPNQSNVLLSNYPNPFYRAAGTTVSVTSDVPGNGTLKVYDVLGNEVAQVPVGELSEGQQDVRISLNRAGIFFARLYVNGEPSGLPLKITSE